VVDEDRTLGHFLKRSVRSQRDFAQVRIVAHAAEHDLGALGGLGRRLRRPAIVLGNPRVGLGAAAVVHGHVVAAPGDEMAGHGETHHAESDECEFAHCSSVVGSSRQGSEIDR
jgi:hypothetical protein